MPRQTRRSFKSMKGLAAIIAATLTFSASGCGRFYAYSTFKALNNSKRQYKRSIIHPAYKQQMFERECHEFAASAAESAKPDGQRIIVCTCTDRELPRAKQKYECGRFRFYR